MLRWFTVHPAAIGETYQSHQRTAFGYGFRLLGAGAACIVHGIFPALFTTTASRAVARISESMVQRGRSGGDIPARSTPRPVAGMRD